MNFGDLGVNDQIVEALGYMGIVEPTPVQQQSIPEILEGHDIISCAQTGTGKTAAFLTPVIQHNIERGGGHLDTIVLCPTRELAIQIDKQVEGLSYFTGVTSYAIYGGGDGEGFDYEKRALTEGTEIIIATPGRLLSHLRLGYVKMENVKHFVLDEADRMLDMGFYNSIMEVFKHFTNKPQTLLFSATMPPKIRSLALKILKDPKSVNIAVSKPAEKITQRAFLVHNENKIQLLEHLLLQKNYEFVIIFCSKKSDVENAVRKINKIGYKAKGISSNLEQEEREEVLRGFKHKDFPILVATDIMARGIDIKGIDLVINYEVPNDAEDYVHRIGRTARADSFGEAFTFINDDDQYKFQKIEKLIERKIEKEATPEEIGPSPQERDFSNFRKNKNRNYSNNKGNKKNYRKPQNRGNRDQNKSSK